ncbi:MAG: ketopantoate reductase family protein [Hyphomicrobiaceae bacterium]
MGERIAIVGAGAVGGHVGGHMARVGADVTFIDPWPAHVDTMNRDGLVLTGMTEPENVTVRVRAIHLTDLQFEARRGGFDIVFLATKSYDTRWAAQMIAGYLAPGGFVVSLQNGINEPAIADVVGWGRTLGVIVSKISVILHAPGQIRRLVQLGGQAHLVFRVGECHGRTTARAERVAELLSAADSSAVTSNLWGERWTKLAVNCMRNPIAAATGRGGNDNDRDDPVRRLSIRIGGEAAKVGRAHGFQLEKLYGVAADDMIAAHAGDRGAMARAEDIILAQTATRSDEQRPSMGQDIEKGRRTEIDDLNGFVALRAGEVGLQAPLNAGIADIVRRVERGEVAQNPELLAPLVSW